MQKKQDEELKVLLVTELLKSKEQEITAAKAGELASLDKCARYKTRAKDALIKQKALEVELNELRTHKADEGKSTKHEQREIDAEAALEKALKQCELFKEEVDTLKTMLETKTSKFNDSLGKYRTRVQTVKSDFEKAESNCQRLATELEEAKQECEALRTAQSLTASGSRQREVPDSEIQRVTKETISAALNRLPVVEDHPFADLKPIGKTLGTTIARLSKETRAGIKGLRRRTFMHTDILFGDNQHGYLLYPQHGLKDGERFGQGVWVKNSSFQLDTPFEAFYQKEQDWYYIGTYQAFLICDAPWETFSQWPKQVVEQVVRSTIIGHSPTTERLKLMRERYQNREVVASYLGIQCVGFKYDLYEKLRQASSEAGSEIKSPREPQGPNKRKRGSDGSAIIKRHQKKRKFQATSRERK